MTRPTPHSQTNTQPLLAAFAADLPAGHLEAYVWQFCDREGFNLNTLLDAFRVTGTPEERLAARQGPDRAVRNDSGMYHLMGDDRSYCLGDYNRSDWCTGRTEFILYITTSHRRTAATEPPGTGHGRRPATPPSHEPAANSSPPSDPDVPSAPTPGPTRSTTTTTPATSAATSAAPATQHSPIVDTSPALTVHRLPPDPPTKAQPWRVIVGAREHLPGAPFLGAKTHAAAVRPVVLARASGELPVRAPAPEGRPISTSFPFPSLSLPFPIPSIPSIPPSPTINDSSIHLSLDPLHLPISAARMLRNSVGQRRAGSPLTSGFVVVDGC